MAASSVEVEAASAARATAPVGTGDGGPLHIGDLPTAGVGLVGPAALDAARAILVAALIEGRRSATAADVHTTDIDFATLLGPAAVHLDGLPGLSVHTGVDIALAAIGRRHRPSTTPTAATAGGYPPVTPPARPVLLLIEAPARTGAEALADILAQPERKITVVLLGAWTDGATWHVRADGTVRTYPNDTTATIRLALLDSLAAADVLSTLAMTGLARADVAAPPTRVSPSHRSVQPVLGSRPPLTLRILGRPTLTHTGVDGDTLVHIRRSAGLQILIYLAVHRDGASTADIKEAVWPDVPSGAAAGRYHTTISELRKALDAAAGSPVIRQSPVTDPAEMGKVRLWLDPDRIQVDLWDLYDSLDAAATAIDPAAQLDDHEVDDMPTLRRAAPAEQPLPPMLLVADTPPPGLRGAHPRGARPGHRRAGHRPHRAQQVVGGGLLEHRHPRRHPRRARAGSTADGVAGAVRVDLDRRAVAPLAEQEGRRTPANPPRRRTRKPRHAATAVADSPDVGTVDDDEQAVAPAGADDNKGEAAPAGAKDEKTPVAPVGADDDRSGPSPHECVVGERADGQPVDEEESDAAGAATAQAGGTDTATTAARAQVRVLGPAHIIDRPVGELFRSDAAELMVYLAVDADGATSEQIQEDLFPR